MDTSRGWGWNDRKVNRGKWGGLQPEVTGCRIQSPHSTVGCITENPGKTRTREGGQEGRMRDVDTDANEVQI